jgi:hypothetical protein
VHLWQARSLAFARRTRAAETLALPLLHGAPARRRSSSKLRRSFEESSRSF